MFFFILPDFFSNYIKKNSVMFFSVEGYTKLGGVQDLLVCSELATDGMKGLRHFLFFFISDGKIDKQKF